jgi:hypothetical protein
MTRMAMSQRVDPRDLRLVKDSCPVVCVKKGYQRERQGRQNEEGARTRPGREEGREGGREGGGEGGRSLPGVSMMRRPGSLTSRWKLSFASLVRVRM